MKYSSENFQKQPSIESEGEENFKLIGKKKTPTKPKELCQG
jgi:hypothetical protein